MIKSKIFNYGNEHEAEWPPQFPQGLKGLVGYVDPKTKEFVEGYPPNPNNQFGVAPSVIFDSMAPAYHEGACRVIESREEWNRLDKEHNLLTFSSVKEPRGYMDKGNKAEAKAIKRDRRKASIEATEMVRANPKEIREKLNKQAENQLEAAKKSGMDKVLKEQGII